MINDALAKYKQHELRTYSLLKTITTSPGHPCPVVLEKILKNFINLSKFKSADMKHCSVGFPTGMQSNFKQFDQQCLTLEDTKLLGRVFQSWVMITKS